MRLLGSLIGTAAVLLIASSTVQAATATVVCAKKGVLQVAIDKFDKAQANTLNISGNCIENIVIDGHRDLSLVGDATAQITAAAAGNAALEVRASRVTLRNMPVNHATLAETGVQCTDRSACLLDGSSVVGGVMAQNQSAIDIVAAPTTTISGSPYSGVGAYGQSSINIRSQGGLEQLGLTILNNNLGIEAADGSFIRVENTTIHSNTTGGIVGNRGAVLKVFGTTVRDNGGPGIFMRGSMLQTSPQGNLPLSITGNAGPGVMLRHLSFGQVFGTISGNQGAYPNGVDCLSTGALRTDGGTRAQSNPMCLQE